MVVAEGSLQLMKIEGVRFSKVLMMGSFYSVPRLCGGDPTVDNLVQEIADCSPPMRG